MSTAYHDERPEPSEGAELRMSSLERIAFKPQTVLEHLQAMLAEAKIPHPEPAKVLAVQSYEEIDDAVIASAFAQAEEELDEVANDFAKQLEARKLSGEVPPPDRVRATALDFIEAVREAEAEGLQVEIELDE